MVTPRGSYWLRSPNGLIAVEPRGGLARPKTTHYKGVPAVVNVNRFRPYVFGASPLWLRPVTAYTPAEEVASKPGRMYPQAQVDAMLDAMAPKPPPEAPPTPKTKLKTKQKKSRPAKPRPKRRHLRVVPDLEPEVQVFVPQSTFLCSACDSKSPMFTITHWRCIGPTSGCACYAKTPDLHDTNKKRMEGQA